MTPSPDQYCLQDRVAIVTGGSAGIGLATALALAAEGARVTVVGRDPHRLADTLSLITRETGNTEILALSLDVRREADMREMADRTLDRWGRIDILVNSAGLLRPAAGALRGIHQTPLEEWDEVLDINLKGTFLTNRAVLRHMVRQRSGDIVNLSSKSGRRGLAFDGPYCASKFGVIGLTQAIAEEVKSYGVRVQVLLPSTFQTGVWAQAGPLPGPTGLPPAERVADAIVFMLKLPCDAVLLSPVVEPLATGAESGWRGGSPASTWVPWTTVPVAG